MKNKLTKEQAAEVYMIIALSRCFNEQLYMMKGAHAGILKKKFNHLLKVSNQYEREAVRYIDGNENMEKMYDSMMEVINTVKNNVNTDE